MIAPDGNRTEYSYDQLLRLTKVKNGKSHVNYRYGPEGRLAERSCSGSLTTSWTYDHAGRLKKLRSENTEGGCRRKAEITGITMAGADS